MHILLSIFKKPLHFIEEKFDREGLFDAIHKLTVRKGNISDPLAWIFVIQEEFSYYDMPFRMSQFITFTEWNEKHVQFMEDGVYVVLTEQDIVDLQEQKNKRQLDAIKKFVKSSLFYPYYIEEQHIQQFLPLLRIKKLKYRQKLNWKDEDGSHKIGIVYKGLISIEYPWKRNIEVVQITKGKYITNNYIKDQLQEISDYELEAVDPKQHKAEEFPKFNYISKSDQTIIIIFNLRLIKESPYNVNPDLLPLIKHNYEIYTQNLYQSIGFTSVNKLYRNKSSIKESLKKTQARQTVKKNISTHISKTSVISSPVLRTFATIELDHSPFSSIYSFDLPLSTREKTKTTMNNPISPLSQFKLRSKTIQTDRPLTQRRLIHNTWIQEMNTRKKPKTKSFSNLQTLSSNPLKRTLDAPSKEEIEEDKKPSFFVPDQFVKKKLRLKYEGLVKRVQNMDLTLQSHQQQTLFEKMARLEEQIQSKRLIKVNNARKKFKLLRDKVQY